MRALLRFLRLAWRRRPRLVSLPTYNLARQAPKLMGQLASARKTLHAVNLRYAAERANHRRAIAEKGELAGLLASVAPENLAAWKAGKRAEARKVTPSLQAAKAAHYCAICGGGRWVHDHPGWKRYYNPGDGIRECPGFQPTLLSHQTWAEQRGGGE